MVSKEVEFPSSGQIIILGEDFRCFGEKSKTAGNLAGSGFYISTPFTLENFSDGYLSFFWEGLSNIRRNPGSYLAPKGLPSLEKGAKEARSFGLFDVDFPHFDPKGMKGEQPSIGFTIRVLEEADQSELVFTGIHEVRRRLDGTILVQFKKFQDAAGQKGALLLPFKRNDQWNLTRLLLQVRGKFEPLV